MDHNYKLYEEYGYKSHELGLFKEWTKLTSSLRENNPKIPAGEAAERAYFELVGSKNHD